MWPVEDSVTGLLGGQTPLNLKAWMHPERKISTKLKDLIKAIIEANCGAKKKKK